LFNRAHERPSSGVGSILREKSNFYNILTKHFWEKRIIQGYSKRNTHFQKFILQVLLNIWRRAKNRLKGELSKSFLHLTSTRCEPHVWCGTCQIEIQLFPHSSQHVTGNSSHSLSDAPLQIINIKNLRDFLSIRTQDGDLTSVVLVKSIFESVYFFLKNLVYHIYF
jgi:hypothetical protein